jgi:hypothetical protein
MALTKVNRGGLNTGISDSSDATFLTATSSEGVTLAGTLAVTGVHTVGNNAVATSEGGAVSMNIAQGLVKAFGKHSASAFVESFNYASFTDHGTGDHTGNFTNNMSNTTYVFGTAGEGGTDVFRYVFLYSPATSSVRFRTAYFTNAVGLTLADLGGNGNQITGDLA